MKISILLPYKENFSLNKAGAVSLYVKDISKHSKYKKNIKIFGETSDSRKLLKNFIHLDIRNRIYLSKTNAYIKEFVKKQKIEKSELIEIHNRPSYVSLIHKELISKIVIYFHNDPLSMKGSISVNERLNLLKLCEKIVFNSNWCKSRFIKNLHNNSYQDKILVIPQSTSKTLVNFKKKKILYLS